MTPAALDHARRAAFSILRDFHAAEDAAQDAAAAILARPDRLRDPSRLPAYLAGIAARRAVDAIRAATRRRRHEAAAGRLRLAGPAAPADDAPLSFPIARAVAALPPAEAHAARFLFMTGRPLAAYAADAGLSLNAAKVRAFRTRAALRRALA